MEESHARYMRLHSIVKDLNSNSLCRTADWYAEHNQLLISYYEYFSGGFADIHPDITDETFRSNCLVLDTLLNKLLKSFNTYQWFSLYDYLVFNETAISVVDAVVEMEDDSMNNLFAKMKV